MASRSKIKEPPSRKSTGSLLITSSLFWLCIIGACYYSNYRELAFFGAVIILVHFVMELITRVMMLLHEYPYFASHYDSKYERLCNSVFRFLPCCTYAILAAVVVVITFKESQPDNCMFYIFLSGAVYVLQPVLQLKNAPVYISHQIESDVVDIGAYMAISFFHGYIKLTLQDQPDSGHGLRSVMAKYEASNSIRFPRKVLYLLVPRSMHCPHRLTDRSMIMEESKSLEVIEQDIAGVKNRNYKNSVYKIKDKDGWIYVVAEYVSPFRTFYESVNNDGVFKEYSDLHRQEVVYKFYKTMEHLVNNDPNTKGLCELIYFDDKDKRGEFVDIGRVLLKRLVANVNDSKL